MSEVSYSIQDTTLIVFYRVLLYQCTLWITVFVLQSLKHSGLGAAAEFLAWN